MVSKEVNVFWLGDAGASTVAVLPDRLGFQLAARSLHAHENRDRQSDESQTKAPSRLQRELCTQWTTDCDGSQPYCHEGCTVGPVLVLPAGARPLLLHWCAGQRVAVVWQFMAESQTHLLGDVVAARAVTRSCAGRLQRSRGAAGSAGMRLLLGMRWRLLNVAASPPCWRALDGRAPSVIAAARGQACCLLGGQSEILTPVGDPALWRRPLNKTPRDNASKAELPLASCVEAFPAVHSTE